MSRPLRIKYEGAWYHVMNRGAGHQNIFFKNAHRELFLKLLNDIHQKFKIEIHAYCLMTNHYHLLVRTPLANLDRCMRHLNGVYTQNFNTDQERDGALFRGRYKSILVEDEDYLIRVSRYIHLNPVMAKMCLHPEDHEWSSYQFYINNKFTPSWLTCGNILRYFGEKYQQHSYIQFMSEGIDQEINTFYENDNLSPILGSDKFIREIHDHFLKNSSPVPEIPNHKIIKNIFVPTLEKIMEVIVQFYNIDFGKISNNHGKISTIKSIFIYLAMEYCQVSLNKIGDKVNGLSRSGVSNNYKRFVAKLNVDSLLLTEVNKIRGMLEVEMDVK